MKNKSLVNKLTKLGVELPHDQSQYSVVIGNQLVTWRNENGHVALLKIQHVKEETNAQIDYFPYFFQNSIKQLIANIGEANFAEYAKKKDSTDFVADC